ncbi:MAG: MBL fold metallo-hydrolase [Desulfobacterales bacterium]
MRPTFSPRLVNGPFDDPGLFIPFQFQNRAILFDLGDISALSSRDILKINHACVSHTHMDHFTGFDRLLRLLMGRDKTLYLYGPRGFLKNIEGKLAGYTWNLVDTYAGSLVLEAAEIHDGTLISRQYPCRNRFEPRKDTETAVFDGALCRETGLTISAVQLDHGIPCLAFTVQENFHVNIRPEALAELELQPGPWLQSMKTALYSGRCPETLITAETVGTRTPIKFPLADLTARIAIITPGQKVSYVADVGYTEKNAELILAHIDHADHLFIETAFLDEHRETARLKNHLTARQAGTLAGLARVKQLTPFHFSPRYAEQGHLLEAEARAAHKAALQLEKNTPITGNRF